MPVKADRPSELVFSCSVPAVPQQARGTERGMPPKPQLAPRSYGQGAKRCQGTPKERAGWV